MVFIFKFRSHHSKSMKTTTFIFIFLSSFILSANSASPTAVLDADGKNLRSGVKYYVMPAARDGKSGGLLPAATGNNSCPLGIAQLRTHKYGLPLTFSPVNPKKGVIRLSTDVNIKFSGDNGCNESNVWKLVYDEGMKQFVVKVGGVEGNPGQKTVDNWFKLEKSGGGEDGYKFVFCPNVCRFCKVICRDLGVSVDGMGVRRLAISDDPLLVIFYT